MIPVERLVTKVASHRCGRWFSAAMEAVAIVVCEPGGVRAIGVRERALPVEELIREIPGLADAIGTCRAG